MTPTQAKTITPIMEDYLEAIYEIGLEKKVVRVKDIAARMGVKNPTVTSMLKNLGGRNLVDYQRYEFVEISSKGKKVAREIHRRHQLLRKFLTEILQVDPRVADDEACKMEHFLSPSTLHRFADFMSFVHECPRTGDSWLERFEEFRQHGHQPNLCRANIESFEGEMKKARERLDQETAGSHEPD